MIYGRRGIGGRRGDLADQALKRIGFEIARALTDKLIVLLWMLYAGA